MNSAETLKGRYLPVSEAGRGGLATVYLGKDLETGGAVALKVSDVTVEGALKAALNESEILLRMECPGIPGFVDYFEENGCCVVVTEFVPGTTVSEMFAGSALHIGKSVLEILKYLHTLDRPVLHLDIKPGNVILSPDGQVFLIDFGSAMREGAGAYVKSGTPEYCAPEQLLGREPDVRTDIYGWGMMMKVLIPEESRDSCMSRIIEKCCAREPEDRYGEVETVLRELEHTYGKGPVRDL